ncbi:sulfatase-like hydrolase/transferase [Myxococcota bacterium]|nr:sulfatase-like hydrolase/transferase [Myxococcota bacterium]
MKSARALLLAAVLLWQPGASSATPPSEGERWNVLLLMAEDLSPRLGVYDDPLQVTPNIDRLAAEGMRFVNAFTSAGVCAPSRSGIIMGTHQNTWGAGHMRAGAGGYAAVPPPGMKAFPERLREAGYFTLNNGKTDYQMDVGLSGVMGGPFTIWDEPNSEDPGLRDEGQPFFAYRTFDNTHESNVWPTWGLGSSPQWFMAPMRLRNHWLWEREFDPAEVPVPPYYPDTPTVRADLARHYNNIAAMDRLVGEALAELERDGLADRTVVIFTTDHGDGLPRAKRWVYDSGIRVPLIVRWPGVTPPGSVNPELVSLVDLAPTILSIAGVQIPEHMQGRVFVGPDKQPEPAYVYAARDRIDDQPDGVRAVRDRRFAYIRNLHPELPYVLDVTFRNHTPMMVEMLELSEANALDGPASLWFRPSRPEEELYDTWSDPHQLHDLANDTTHARTLERMRRELDRWLEVSGDLGLLPEEELAQRMWPDGQQPVTEAPSIERLEDGRIELSSNTPGASLGWSLDGGPWKLYTAPFPASPDAEIRTKAIRYGFKESEEVQ